MDRGARYFSGIHRYHVHQGSPFWNLVRPPNETVLPIVVRNGQRRRAHCAVASYGIGSRSVLYGAKALSSVAIVESLIASPTMKTLENSSGTPTRLSAAGEATKASSVPEKLANPIESTRETSTSDAWSSSRSLSS